MNIWKIIYLNCGERYEVMIDHRSYTHNLCSCEIKAWKRISGLNGIRTHDLCDTGAVLYRLRYQAIWELVILWVRNIPVEGEGCKWIYERSYIWTAEKETNSYDWSSQLYTTSLYRTKPRYSEHIPPVPWLFVISRFHSWLAQNYWYIYQWNLLMGNKGQIAICLAFSWSPGVWAHFFLGIKEVTRFRGNPTSAFAFCYQGEPKKWSDVW